MQRLKLISLAALLLGAAGGLIRTVELGTAFDPVTGLPEPGSAARVMLIVLTVAVGIGALVFALMVSGSYKEPPDYIKTFRVRVPIFALLQIVLGFMVAVSGLWSLGLSTPPMALIGISKWVFVVMMVLTGLCMAGTAYCAFSKRVTSLLPLGCVLPAVFYCYWMVCLYRVNAGNPVLTDYCYSALALAAASMSFYYNAGYAYGRKNLTASVFMGLGAIYLLLVAAADPAPLPLRVALISSALYETATTFCLLSSVRPPKRRAKH